MLWLGMLILLLGDESFQVRQEASIALDTRMDYSLAKFLEGFESDDREVQRRVHQSVNTYWENLRKEYQVRRQDYAWYQIDQGLGIAYRWNDLSYDEIIACYRHRARELGCSWCSPYWEADREGCRMWIEERMDTVFKEARNAPNELRFRRAMNESMDAIQRDLDLLEIGDRRFYELKNEPFPYEK